MKLKSDCKVSIRNEALLLKYNKLHKVEGISVLALQQNLKLKIKCIMLATNRPSSVVEPLKFAVAQKIKSYVEQTTPKSEMMRTDNSCKLKMNKYYLFWFHQGFLWMEFFLLDSSVVLV